MRLGITMETGGNPRSIGDHARRSVDSVAEIARAYALDPGTMSLRALLQDSAVPLGKATAAAVAWQYRGELRVSVIAKAAFAFDGEGGMTLADPQPILGEDVHHARNPLRSIQFATDLVPYRKRADVLFTGYAYAPGAGPVEAMNVRLAVLGAGERSLVDKTLLVRKKGGFQKTRVSYDYAVGRSDHPDNPFGDGFPEDAARAELHVFDPRDAARVAGFAPIPQTMNPRRRLLGALPLPSFGRQVVQIPDGFDFDFFQTAPVDQRTDFLRGDEQIVLEGLHPASPRLRMCLPGARCLAWIHGLSGLGIQEGQPLAMYADTLHVSGDDQRCHVTWRGSFPVRSEAALAAVPVVAGVELPGAPVAWPDPGGVERLLARGGQDDAPGAAWDGHRTLSLSDDDFVVVSTRTWGMETLPASSRSVSRARRHATLPFRPSPASAVAPAAPAGRAVKRGAGSGGETLPIPSDSETPPWGSALPFAPALTSAAGASPAVEAAPAEAAAVAPPEPVAEATKEPPASPWAPAVEAPPPAAPRRPEKKAPPNVDVKNKLYGKKR